MPRHRSAQSRLGRQNGSLPSEENRSTMITVREAENYDFFKVPRQIMVQRSSLGNRGTVFPSDPPLVISSTMTAGNLLKIQVNDSQQLNNASFITSAFSPLQPLRTLNGKPVNGYNFYALNSEEELKVPVVAEASKDEQLEQLNEANSEDVVPAVEAPTPTDTEFYVNYEQIKEPVHALEDIKVEIPLRYMATVDVVASQLATRPVKASSSPKQPITLLQLVMPFVPPTPNINSVSFNGLPKQTRYVSTWFEIAGPKLHIFMKDIQEELKFWVDQEQIICCEIYWSAPCQYRDPKLEQSIRSAVNRHMIAVKWQLAKLLNLNSIPQSLTEESVKTGIGLTNNVNVGLYRQYTPKLLEYLHQDTAKVHGDYWDFEPNETPIAKLIREYGVLQLTKRSVLAINMICLDL